MVKSTPAKRGTHKAFADIAPECFSKAEMAYIRERTACGPSALDVVRQAVRQAARNHTAERKKRPPVVMTDEQREIWRRHRETMNELEGVIKAQRRA